MFIKVSSIYSMVNLSLNPNNILIDANAIQSSHISYYKSSKIFNNLIYAYKHLFSSQMYSNVIGYQIEKIYVSVISISI